jgi:sialic acid synthase
MTHKNNSEQNLTTEAVMRSLSIDGIQIDDSSECYVIAEIGHNHQGSLEKAKEMFRAAKESGVHAVKLQKRDNRSLFTKAMYDKPYENENSFGSTYGAHREALEFGKEEYVELARYAAELGVTMFATAFDFPSVDFLAELDTPAFKIASGDLTNTPLLKHVASVGKPVLISTGGAGMDDVRRAVDAVLPINRQIAILQCTACYPSTAEEMNLRVIDTFRREFPELVIGLSDHYNGISMAVVAYMLGARIIEKHFTMNHTWKGTDHAMSLEPIGMHKMVRDLNRARAGLGDGVKQPRPNEMSAIEKMGKSIVAARDLAAGHVIKAEDLAFKSPGGGLPPYRVDQVIGQKLTTAVAADAPVLMDSLVGTGGNGKPAGSKVVVPA